MVDCASFMRYTGETLNKLSPLEGPAITSDHLDIALSNTPFDDEDDGVFDDILQLPAVQLARYIARKTRRKYAAHQPKSLGLSTTLSL